MIFQREWSLIIAQSVGIPPRRNQVLRELREQGLLGLQEHHQPRWPEGQEEGQHLLLGSNSPALPAEPS